MAEEEAAAMLASSVSDVGTTGVLGAKLARRKLQHEIDHLDGRKLIIKTKPGDVI